MLSRSAAAVSATACPATTVPVLAKVPVSYGVRSVSALTMAMRPACAPRTDGGDLTMGGHRAIAHLGGADGEVVAPVRDAAPSRPPSGARWADRNRASPARCRSPRPSRLPPAWPLRGRWPAPPRRGRGTDRARSCRTSTSEGSFQTDSIRSPGRIMFLRRISKGPSPRSAARSSIAHSMAKVVCDGAVSAEAAARDHVRVHRVPVGLLVGAPVDGERVRRGTPRASPRAWPP